MKNPVPTARTAGTIASFRTIPSLRTVLIASAVPVFREVLRAVAALVPLLFSAGFLSAQNNPIFTAGKPSSARVYRSSAKVKTSTANVGATINAGTTANARTTNEQNQLSKLKCPVPIWDAKPSKTVFCDTSCASMIVRGPDPLDTTYMMPSWGIFLIGLDGTQCTDLTMEVWENGVINAAVGKPDPRCTGGCVYLGSWATWFGVGNPLVCTPGQTIELNRMYFTLGNSVEIRLYDTHPGVYAWTLLNDANNVIVGMGSWSFASIGAGYGTTGVITAGLSTETAAYTCPTCPAGTLKDNNNGTADFCPTAGLKGKFGVTYTFSTDTCTNTYTDTLVAQPAPVASVSSQSNIGCNGDQTGAIETAVSSGTPVYKYSWSSGATTMEVAGVKAGSYTLTVTDQSGCTSTTTATLTQPDSALSINPPDITTAGCGSTSGATASVTVMGGTRKYTYDWQPLGGSAAQATNLATGNYTLSVTDANGCTDQTVVVIPTTVDPVAQFSPLNTKGNSPLKVDFTNTSTGSVTYTWNFGDGKTDTVKNPVHTYVSRIDTTYHACLVAVSAGNCRDSVCTTVTVYGADSVRIPNIFTPNSDGVNDVFTLYTQGIVTMQISIWDRWGLKIRELSGPTAAWDGRTNAGEPCPGGTYYYIINAVDRSSRNSSYKGYVSLVR